LVLSSSSPSPNKYMFETVAPQAFQTRSRRVFYETLPLSIAVHVVGIGAALAGMFWNVALPTQSPRMYVAYNLTKIPDPPPPPPPPPKVEPPKPVLPLAQLAPPPPPTQIVAPTVIPDVIPDVPPQPVPQPAAPVPVAAVPAVADSAPAKGVPGGQVGGTGHSIGIAKGINMGEDGRVYIDRNVNLPLKEIDHEYPHYPSSARKMHLEGTCVVRYTIGKNGRVIDVAILDHAPFPIFDDETINTVRSWSYRPMMVSGQPVEVVHELAVTYEYIVR
jgi:protein TonB